MTERKPPHRLPDDMVNSVEELDALLVESVVSDPDGLVYTIVHNGERNHDGSFYREFLLCGDLKGYTAKDIELPAHVLRNGGAPQ